MTFSESEFWLTSWAGLLGILASILTKHVILSAVINLVLWPLKSNGKSSKMLYVTEFIWIGNTIQITCQLVWHPALPWTWISTAIWYWDFGYRNYRFKRKKENLSLFPVNRLWSWISGFIKAQIFYFFILIFPYVLSSS